jgi:dTDP-4-dehydrorhamnose 3,5-epimerase
MIAGVERRKLEPHSDARGTLRELWRRSSQPIEVQQVLVTSSTAGTLRGMHYHLRQSDLCYVVTGAVFMALVDLRTEPTAKEEIRLADTESIFIPPGVAHGYATERGAIVCYLLTEEVDGSDEFGFRYDDRDAAIRWPIAAPTLSERDRTAGTLRDAIAAVRSHQSRYAGSVAP